MELAICGVFFCIKTSSGSSLYLTSFSSKIILNSDSPLQTKDGRLCIFACDYFNLTPDLVGSVDAVYDRGALGAINLQDRQAYVKLMQKLLGKEFR